MVFQQQCLTDNLLHSESSLTKRENAILVKGLYFHQVIAIKDLPCEISHNNMRTQSTVLYFSQAD